MRLALCFVISLTVLFAPPLAAQEPPPSPAPEATPPPAPPDPAVTVTTVPPAGAPAAAPAAPAPVALPILALPDPSGIAPAEVSYVNPFYRAFEAPARAIERPQPTDLETVTPLVLTLHVNETGRVVEGQAVEPPLKGLVAAAIALMPRWTFTPAKKGGLPIATWATYVIDLAVELEKAAFSGFLLTPVGKDEALPTLIKEGGSGEAWMSRYPREIAPKDVTALSIEDVDAAPVPDKTKWSVDDTRLRSRITALIEVSANGTPRRIVGTGNTEPLMVAWLRDVALKWKLAPALDKGNAIDSWLALDATLEYTLGGAKERGKRVVKKNLRGTPKD